MDLKTSCGLVAALLMGGATHAQMVSYKTNNQTKKLAPVKAALTLSFASGFQTSAGLLVQGCVVNKLFYHGEYRQGLFRGFSNNGAVDKEQLMTTQDETNGKYLELGAEWAIADNTGSGKLKVVTVSGMNSERYFKADCDLRKLVTVGGGIFSISHAYYLSSDSGQYFMSGGTKLRPAKDMIMHSAVNTSGIFGGISFRKIKKAAVSSGGYRYRNFKATSWSFQALMGSSNMQDMVIAGKTYPIDNFKSSPLGYRIMWRADRGSTSTCVELGKMPHAAFDNDNYVDMSMYGPEGISSPVNYFRLSFNFILYGNDRKYALKQKKE